MGLRPRDASASESHTAPVTASRVSSAEEFASGPSGDSGLPSGHARHLCVWTDALCLSSGSGPQGSVSQGRNCPFLGKRS